VGSDWLFLVKRFDKIGRSGGFPAIMVQLLRKVAKGKEPSTINA
jgi:hypothetical protein